MVVGSKSSFDLRSLGLIRDDDWFHGLGQSAVVADARVIPQIPGQRPVIWRHNGYPGASLTRPAGVLVDFIDELVSVSLCVGVDINIVNIVVVVIDEVQIAHLVRANENRSEKKNGR